MASVSRDRSIVSWPSPAVSSMQMGCMLKGPSVAFRFGCKGKSSDLPSGWMMSLKRQALCIYSREFSDSPTWADANSSSARVKQSSFFYAAIGRRCERTDFLLVRNKLYNLNTQFPSLDKRDVDFCEEQNNVIQMPETISVSLCPKQQKWGIAFTAESWEWVTSNFSSCRIMPTLPIFLVE